MAKSSCCTIALLVAAAVAVSLAAARPSPQGPGDFQRGFRPSKRVRFPSEVEEIPAARADRQTESTERARAINQSPAVPAPILFVGPEYDVFGNPIIFEDLLLPEDEFLPDFRKPVPVPEPTPRPKPELPRKNPTKSDPQFSRDNLILRATKDLWKQDVNQESLLPWGSANAGILPLAVSNNGASLSLFPPFNLLEDEDQ